MIQNRKIVFSLFMALFFIFWNLMEYAYAVWITHSACAFLAIDDLLIPLAVGAVIGYLQFLRRKNP